MSIMHSAWIGDISNSIIHRSAIVAHHQQASRRIEMVQGDYEFSFVWNVHVPGKPEFEAFQARK